MEGTPARVVIVAEVPAAGCFATLIGTLQREIVGVRRDLDRVLEEAELCMN